jgi:hypothetical protein
MKRIFAILAAVFLLASCSKREAAPMATARVLTIADMWKAAPLASLGDSAYAEVNSAWLRGYYDEFRSEIFRQGVTTWDTRFDCNHFASYYAALAQTKFYLANFQSRTRAQSLAVGTLWYTRAAGGGHAIVIAVTERGTLYIEPQTGQEVALTQAELNSATLKVF